MDFKCDRCHEVKDVGDVVRTNPFSQRPKIVCYDCYDRQDEEDLKKKRVSAYDWLMSIFKP